MAVFCTLYQFRFVILFQLTTRMIEVVNYMLQYSVALYTYWCIIFDSNRQMRENQRFWKVVEKADKFPFTQNDIQLKHYCSKFLLCFYTSALGILSTIVKTDGEYKELMFVYLFLIKICEARAFYYIFCLEVLQFQLNKIEKVPRDQHDDQRTFKQMRGHYVYDMTNHLNNAFGVSQVAMILFCFYFLLTDINWAYVDIVNTNQTVMQIFSKFSYCFLLFN